MKKNYLTLITILFLIPFIGVSQTNDDQLMNAPGDIAITAYYTPTTFGTTGFAFLLLDDCPAGGSITFIDDEWNGAAFSTGEGVSTWSTASALPKGTLIEITNVGATPAANVGTITETVAGMALSNGDGLYAIAGTRSSPTAFLSFVGVGQNFTGTGLVDGVNAHVTSIRGYYNGTSVFNGTIAAVATAINSATWVGTSGFTFPANIIRSYSGSAFATLSINDNEFNLKDITLYPNPTTSSIKLKLLASEKAEIQIFNAMGKLIKTEKKYDANEKIDVSEIATGLYFVKVNINGLTVTRKFIKSN